MKKVITIIIMFIVALSLFAACKSKEQPKKPQQQEEQQKQENLTPNNETPSTPENETPTKQDNVLSFSIQPRTYNGSEQPLVKETEFQVFGDATLYYKKQGDDDTTYVTKAPLNA